jgi:hypothetical protein
MGEAGRHTAARFSWDHVAAQMEDLYASLTHRVRLGAPANT